MYAILVNIYSTETSPRADIVDFFKFLSGSWISLRTSVYEIRYDAVLEIKHKTHSGRSQIHQS
jgi:hypothetical protein